METSLMKQRSMERKREENQKILKAFMTFWVAAFMIVMTIFAVTSFATNTEAVTQPLSRLNDIIFAILKMVGIALIAFGVLQLGLSFRSQNTEQRSNGLLSVVGGVIVLVGQTVADTIMNG